MTLPGLTIEALLRAVQAGEELRYFPSHRRRDHAQLIHQFRELIGKERLRAIRKCLIRIVMDFDQQRICSRRQRCPRHGRHFVAQSGAVRRIGSHGQVRQLLDDRNSGNIQRVARVGFESADAALAQNHVVVSARHDVFGGEQQLFERGRDAALEQHRFFDLAQFAQQIEILHVARAHLEDVNVGQHQRDLRNLHDLADHQQIEMLAGLAQKLEPFLPHSLERIR